MVLAKHLIVDAMAINQMTRKMTIAEFVGIIGKGMLRCDLFTITINRIKYKD